MIVFLKNQSKKIVLIFILALLFLLMNTIWTRKYPESIFYPLTAHPLTTLSGSKIQLETEFSNQDYLLIFFAATSPTSHEQLQEISKVTAKLPPNLAIICVHIGKLNQRLDDWKNPHLHFFLDPEIELSQKLQICAVPTIFLINKNHREIFSSQKFVSANELLNQISNLDRFN